MRRLAPLLLAAALAACELTEVATSPTADVLVVEATLRAGEPVQRVLLHRSFHSGGASPDAGAEVSVATESGRVVSFQPAPLDSCTQGLTNQRQEEAAAGATCFLSPPASSPWVQPGATYTLVVRAPDGRVVRGRTTVPGGFRFASPSLSASRGSTTCSIPPRTGLPLVWTVSEGAWVYRTKMVVHGLDTALAGAGIQAPGRVEFAGVVVSARDTTRTLPADFVFDRLDLHRDLLLAIRDGFPEGTRLELVVAAADRNHVNAVRGGGFNPSGNVRISSVVGDGVGYFGSLVPLQLGVVVTAEAGTHLPCEPVAAARAPIDRGAW